MDFDKDYRDFEKWYRSQEERFHQAQFDEKQVAYSAWLESRKRGPRNSPPTSHRVPPYIIMDNPAFALAEPLAFECLTCGNLFFEVGFDEYTLKEKAEKSSYYRKVIKEMGIKHTEHVGPTPCGHFLGERYKGRFGPFSPEKVEKLRKILRDDGRVKT